VLPAAGGLPNAEIGRQVGRTRQAVIVRRARQEAGGILALVDRSRSRRSPVIGEAPVITHTLNPPPLDLLDVVRWSTRLPADHGTRAGTPVSVAEVARMWRGWDLRPATDRAFGGIDVLYPDPSTTHRARAGRRA
jgi:hypothetical protein